MKNEQWAPLVFEPLSSARRKLAGILPPQPDKILRALQNVERALQYSEIEGSAEHVLEVSRNALRALNMVDKPRELSPRISLAIATSVAAIVKAVRTIEAKLPPPAAGADSHHAAAPRKAPLDKKAEEGSSQSDDDTVDLLVCSEDLFFEAHGCRDGAQPIPAQRDSTSPSDISEAAPRSR